MGLAVVVAAAEGGQVPDVRETYPRGAGQERRLFCRSRNVTDVTRDPRAELAAELYQMLLDHQHHYRRQAKRYRDPMAYNAAESFGTAANLAERLAFLCDRRAAA